MTFFCFTEEGQEQSATTTGKERAAPVHVQGPFLTPTENVKPCITCLLNEKYIVITPRGAGATCPGTDRVGRFLQRKEDLSTNQLYILRK